MELGTLVVGALGGIVTIFANSVLERLKSKHSLTNEQYKIQLKKSEFFFQEQFKAAVKFGKFFNSILPEKEYFLMEWEDAASSITADFKHHQAFLDEFISDFDVLFSEDIIILLYQCKNVIITYNDDLSLHKMNGYDSQSWENTEWDYGDKFYVKIESCRNAIKQTIIEQVKF